MDKIRLLEREVELLEKKIELLERVKSSESDMSVDVRHIGVPNICFSLTDLDDDREEKYSEQRIERGFDNSELWSLYSTIAGFVLPRLKAFREVSAGWPGGLDSEDEWNSILDKIITSFEIIVNEEEMKREEELCEGMDLFRDWFFALWF